LLPSQSSHWPPKLQSWSALPVWTGHQCFDVFDQPDFKQMSFVKFSFPNCDYVHADFHPNICKFFEIGGIVCDMGWPAFAERILGVRSKRCKKNEKQKNLQFSLRWSVSWKLLEIVLQFKETEHPHLQGLHVIAQELRAAFRAFV
jgi:hypothetical protein